MSAPFPSRAIPPEPDPDPEPRRCVECGATDQPLEEWPACRTPVTDERGWILAAGYRCKDRLTCRERRMGAW